MSPLKPPLCGTSLLRHTCPRPRIAVPPTRRSISAYGYEQAKALTFRDYGEPKDILKLHQHSISPAHGNLVTLRFLAAPINPADINQLQGVYPSKPAFTTALGTTDPIAVGGNEGVAEVMGAGSGVTGFRKGDWVVMRAPGFGTWRTHAQTTTENLVKVEKDGITAIQAGTVSVNPCTAYRMLKDFVPMREGDWFIQNGANSGVGRAAMQLGRLWGYKSINIIRKRESGMEEMRDELKELGADVVVTDEEVMEKGFSDKVKEWTNGGREKVRLGLNCVGGKIVNSMAKTLAPDAHMVTYGAMSKQPVTLPAGILIFKNISFDGFWVSKWSERHPEEKQKTVEHVLDLTRQGKFKDTPVQEVPWSWNTKEEELVRAVQGTLEGFRSGKEWLALQVFSNSVKVV
ncbi:mitochondrial 2-enoyl thioester reductase [Elasticomyces elasticus]|nr:mitochondrial 2-enoyl thioester reductase [Elasticomyces elasticus]